ncbi:alpha-amylase family glycosyl hydrolase [Nibrella saemangeumensis]|uniref:Alpha-amylase family glycosyl hydrolase n=1 Tax=Nibrella saemangeumensis TaxID=1084526 RepID=A0ABP8MZZ6_9BACT
MASFQRLSDIDFAQLTNRPFYPSPLAWEDQVLYFLMLDRFSDGNESGYLDNEGNPVAAGTTPLFRRSDDYENAIGTRAEAETWRDAGGRFAGGTLRGLESKIGYLKRLGITAIWISPVFKQVVSQESYHGYGIQHFLDVEPRFGTADELRRVVQTAHDHGIYVILDIIFNHAGDVFGYNADRYDTFDEHRNITYIDPRWDGRPYVVAGYRDSRGDTSLPFQTIDLAQHPDAWPDGAIWPAEFQTPDTFTRRGRINSWDHDPEYLEGDFFTLKDILHGSGQLDDYQPSPGLKAICEVYKYWIAFADLDGFRIDTVKHMDLGASRYFTAVIKEFTMSLGKENFYLIGEITGGRQRAFTTLELTGIDAALGVDDIPDKMEYLVKGYRNPTEYFSLFRNSELIQKESHIWFRNRVVTMVDDHDQVRKGENKARFCAAAGTDQQLVAVVALNVTTLGIPCLYYGTEQRFDGHGKNDRYLREAMFGGEFGAFRSRNRHFFDEDNEAYRKIADILAVRRQHLALRRGRQYLRPISGDGLSFGLPQMLGGQIRSVVPWSRLFNNQELLCAINTDADQPRTAWVTIDNELHRAGERLRCIYSTDLTVSAPDVEVEARNGKAIRITVPAAGFVIYG